MLLSFKWLVGMKRSSAGIHPGARTCHLPLVLSLGPCSCRVRLSMFRLLRASNSDIVQRVLGRHLSSRRGSETHLGAASLWGGDEQ